MIFDQWFWAECACICMFEIGESYWIGDRNNVQYLTLLWPMVDLVSFTWTFFAQKLFFYPLFFQCVFFLLVVVLDKTNWLDHQQNQWFTLHLTATTRMNRVRHENSLRVKNIDSVNDWPTNWNSRPMLNKEEKKKRTQIKPNKTAVIEIKRFWTNSIAIELNCSTA